MARPLPDDEPDDGVSLADPATPGDPVSTGAVDGRDDGLVPAAASRPVPSRQQLEKVAVDVRIRRRPRYGVFVATGVLIAGIAGLVWAVNVPQSAHENWGARIPVATKTP